MDDVFLAEDIKRARENILKTKKQYLKTDFLCTTCGYIGVPGKANRGSGMVELALWFFLIIPGIIYSCWRSSAKYIYCPACKKETLIPATSPVAQKLI